MDARAPLLDCMRRWPALCGRSRQRAAWLKHAIAPASSPPRCTALHACSGHPHGPARQAERGGPQPRAHAGHVSPDRRQHLLRTGAFLPGWVRGVHGQATAQLTAGCMSCACFLPTRGHSATEPPAPPAHPPAHLPAHLPTCPPMTTPTPACLPPCRHGGGQCLHRSAHGHDSGSWLAVLLQHLCCSCLFCCFLLQDWCWATSASA